MIWTVPMVLCANQHVSGLNVCFCFNLWLLLFSSSWKLVCAYVLHVVDFSEDNLLNIEQEYNQPYCQNNTSAPSKVEENGRVWTWIYIMFTVVGGGPYVDIVSWMFGMEGMIEYAR